MQRVGVVGAGVVALAVAAAGCSSSSMDLRAEQRADTSQGVSDDRWINEMTVAGVAEVQVGQMAAERAKNPGVKALGRMMVQDQSQTNRELTQIAAQLSILPSQQLDLKHQYLADRLSAAQGAEFDREYLKAMVEGHEEVLNKLEMRASQDGSALAEWATRMQPKVQQHLDRARQLQQQLAR